MGFLEKLTRIARRNDSWLCIGLDPDPEHIPPHIVEGYGDGAILEFNRRLIEATRNLVCAYKPNSAFYEGLGPHGLKLLQETCRAIPEEIPVILDAKRGDIANSAQHYARAAFEIYGADGVVVNPYMGSDAIRPFLSYGDRGVFLLCRTSNPGAQDLQDLECGGRPLYHVVAELASRWRSDAAAEVGLVMGATVPAELATVRGIVGEEMLLLVPGVGAQQGDLGGAVRAAVNSRGEGAIISASRSVLYVSQREDFAQAAQREAMRLRDDIERMRRDVA